MFMRLDLEQLIFALSDTVDLVGVNDILHSKRVSCMVWKCAEAMGFDKKRQTRLFHLGLLHDCGVSSTKERRHLITELDWIDSNIHCRVGAERVKHFDLLKTLNEPILYHHTRWEELKDLEIPNKTKMDANLIFLLDRVDHLGQVTPGKNWISKKNVIRQKINRFNGTYFHPDLTDGFLRCSDNEAFWFSLEPLMLTDFVEQRKRTEDNIGIPFDQLKNAAELFAQIVDAKSPFTAAHSSGVARVAMHLAELAGLDRDTCLKIEAAGLLHDLGKLQVPDSVLENTGPLGDDELSSMRHHSYLTYHILKQITGFEDIALWAANHHEALDGSGYPFRRKGDELGIESRILAVADIFQALAQDRPYRDAKPLESIVTILEKHAQKGRLDTTLVELVTDNQEHLYQAATAA
jgi:putative nucleotidyltransferase with HDIG domain